MAARTDIPALASTPGNATPGDSNTENSIAHLKHEEIVLVLPTKEKNGGYLIYSLTEAPTSDGGTNPFNLSVVHSQLPEDSPLLAEFLLDQNNLPPPHLRGDSDGSTREVQVVVSTHSGMRLASDFYEGALRPLLSVLGVEESTEGQEGGYQVTATRDSNTIRDLAQGLSRSGETTIILLSGDGGVVDMLNGLDQTDATPTVALLPLGTGNALFHSLHKPHYAGPAPTPSPLVLSLRTLAKGTPAPLPTFRASFSPGARLASAPAEPGSGAAADATTTEEEGNKQVDHLIGAIVASYGFHASLVWESDTPAYRTHGDKRFGMAAAELLKVAHAYEATVEVRRNGSDSDDFVRLRGEGEMFDYVLTALVSNLEKTFAISPDSKPLDGRLRLVHFGDVGGDKTMEIMMAAYREGEHVHMAEVGYEEVEEVRVTIREEDARWRKVCVDGSIVEIESGGWMAVRREERERLRVLVNGRW